jgi:hypothetical protein
MGLILSWSFSIEDYVSPWLENEEPTTPAGLDDNISVDILDDASGVALSSLQAYVNGALAFSGPGTFVPPYNGYNSSILPVIVDGYNGYHLVLDNTGRLVPSVDYTIRVLGQDSYGNSFDESFTFRTVLSTSIIDLRPELYEITLDLTFDTPMLEDENLINPANYTFEGYGTYARKVDILAPDKVRLWVELFYGQDNFEITVNSAIKNIDGYSILPPGNTYGVSPFKADATFTNYNAMVRTWHDSNIIAADSQRVYLSGTKGIDVFRKESATRFARWGQIFDEYGIDSMYVANYPSDLIITDTTAPELVDVNPVPNSYVSADTRLSFKVRDTTTAVEITNLRVYVDGDLAFSGGYGGWGSGWSGIIETSHHQLEVEMWPNTYFSTGSVVNVRIVAEDLLGNGLDESYVFYIIVPIGGFGGVPFGWSPFGNV